MNRFVICLLGFCLSISQLSCVSEIKEPEENLLWQGSIKNDIISYAQPNKMRTYDYNHPDAPLDTCRVYSNVSVPTYYLYEPKPQKNAGLGMVVLPGGGYKDIWLDKEGHNIGLFFKEHGITSLVVKYRTNTPDKEGNQPMTQEEYLPAAISDAREGIRILRSKAKDLKIDPAKIGVGGFSAGGHLTLSVVLSPEEKDKESYPNFAFLIYPWIQDSLDKQVAETKDLPPMFIVNGQEDDVTPPDTCTQFYYMLCENKVPAELHIYRKGKHGFSFGLGTGHSLVQWTSSFIAWLKDIDMISAE